MSTLGPHDGTSSTPPAWVFVCDEGTWTSDGIEQFDLRGLECGGDADYDTDDLLELRTQAEQAGCDLAVTVVQKCLDQRQPEPDPEPRDGLTGYDTGTVCEPVLWQPTPEQVRAAHPDRLGTVDFDNDEGGTVCAVRVLAAGDRWQVIIDPHSDGQEFDVFVDGVPR